jgi:hypothetical protein
MLHKICLIDEAVEDGSLVAKMMEMGLLAAEMICVKCHSKMSLRTRGKAKDGVEVSPI